MSVQIEEYTDELKSRRFSAATLALVRKAFKELERRHGGATGEQFVDLARPKSSPYHHLFNWDDRSAANAFRIDQANRYIRTLKISFITENEEKRTISYAVNVHTEQGRMYRSILKVKDEPTQMNEVLATAKAQFIALRDRYHYLSEFAALFKLIDKM